MSRTRSIHMAVAGFVALATIAAGCTTNPPAAGNQYIYKALAVTAVTTPGDSPITFWDNDSAEEPYLVHLALRIKLNAPIAISLDASSSYSNGGQYICKINQGETCPGLPNDGPIFSGLKTPDLMDLATGAPFELVGSVDFLYERDALIPIGIIGLLQGVAQVANAALPTLLGAGGIPSDAEGIIAFLGKLLPGIVSVIVGAVGSVLGNLIGADELLGLSPMFFISVGGALASIIRGVLPSLLGLVNFALAQQKPNPFPNGLPISIGVVGDGPTVRYGSATQVPFRVYDVRYGWDILS